MIQNSKFKIQNFLAKPIFFLIIGLVLYFGFGLANITQYVTADEHFWFPNFSTERLQEYWRALADGDLKKTQINDKPGVSLALISGIAIPFAQDAIQKQVIFDDGTVKRYDPEATKKINLLFRFPLLLFNGLFIFYFYWILRKITRDDWVSLWASLFILLSPIILGISQIVNPDTLFWSFGSATFLTFFAYLQKRETKFFLLAVPLFGFTLLSKYVGVIFFPFFFAMILIKYLFSAKPEGKIINLSQKVKKDLLAYATTLLGGVVVFALFMPAAIVEPKILYESTIGFPGMLPIFILIAGCAVVILADACIAKSFFLEKIISFLAPRKKVLEKILYAILLGATLFTLFNWLTRNSIVDFSDIPFDAKTKASFTDENSYLSRFIAEWVPLVFALTPLTLILLILSWAQALFGSIRKRTLAFTLSSFFLVFYIAVIEQGLLVTTRYSIILFPFVFILSALSFQALFFPKTATEKFFSRFAVPTFLFFILFILGVLSYHDSLSLGDAIRLENFLSTHRILIALALIFVFVGILFLVRKIFSKIEFPTLSPIWLTVSLLAIGSLSLVFTFPHYFIYANSLLPERYILFHPWGYGGYQAAQYLNQKPNAKNLTLWTDAYGVCEFFVGKCIKKPKVNTEKYPINYILRTFRGQINPKFKANKDEEPEWKYLVGERKKNFIKIYKNNISSE